MIVTRRFVITVQFNFFMNLQQKTDAEFLKIFPEMKPGDPLYLTTFSIFQIGFLAGYSLADKENLELMKEKFAPYLKQK